MEQVIADTNFLWCLAVWQCVVPFPNFYSLLIPNTIPKILGNEVPSAGRQPLGNFRVGQSLEDKGSSIEEGDFSLIPRPQRRKRV